MEQSPEAQQNLSANPTARSRLLFFSLGITFLTILLYILLSYLADWLPEAYKDISLAWAGPLEGLPPEGVWLVQSLVLRILICGCFLGLLHGLVKLFSGKRLRLAFGSMKKEHRALLAKNIVIYFVLIIAQNILFSFLDLGRLSEQPETQTVMTGWWGIFSMFLFVAVAAPLFEEALFRGFLYARLRSAFRFWPAFLVSGLFFSLLHFDTQGSAISNIFNIADTFIFSYFVTKTFEETGNLWTAVIFHAVYNGWLMILFSFFSVLESLTPFT